MQMIDINTDFNLSGVVWKT